MVYNAVGVMMRMACLECVVKHVGQALVLMSEAEKGYPHYYIYAIGHLAEAEDECMDYRDLRDRIHKFRLDYMNGVPLEFDEFVEYVFNYCGVEVE
jgi:hypothetical protein